MIPVNTPLLSGNELEYVSKCITDGWISSEGAYVAKFESGVASYLGRKHGVAVVNGTAALQVALDALQLPRGSEVILPSLSIISCAAAVVRAGLIPVPVDCDMRTFNMGFEHVEAAVTDRTSAIMVVHTYGLPVDIEPILELAKARGLKVIEDAAEVIGQTYNGNRCGSFGDISILSFYPNKHITTGEGGMVLTDSESLRDRCCYLRNLAFETDRRFVHEELGWNYRMSNLQAAVGCAQLEKINAHLEKKRLIGQIYHDELKDLQGLALPVPEAFGVKNIYWVFTLVLDAKSEMTAKVAMQRLADRGIGTRPCFWPVHKQPVFLRQYSHYAQISLPNSEFLSEMSFYLPSGLGLDVTVIPNICDEVRNVINKL